MYAWLAVAAGGALGSVARHGVNRLVHQAWPLMRFPLATVIVNLVGCAVIGLLAGLIAAGRLPMRANWREFVFVGILFLWLFPLNADQFLFCQYIPTE